MGFRSSTLRRRAAVLLALLGAVALVVAFGASVALTLAPGLLLAALLLHGIRPGEEFIARVRRARARVRRRIAATVAPDLPVVLLRAGRWLHVALAMRPPPAAARPCA